MKKTTKTILTLAATGPMLSLAAAELKDPIRLDKLDPKALEGPECADLNGDGKLDMISGLYSGTLLYRENIGTPKDPKFAVATALQAGGKDIKMKHW